MICSVASSIQSHNYTARASSTSSQKSVVGHIIRVRIRLVTPRTLFWRHGIVGQLTTSYQDRWNMRKSNLELQTAVATGNDAEFLLRRCKRTRKLCVRVGRVWTVPRMLGTSTILLDYDDCKAVNNWAIRERLRACGLSAVRIYKKRSPSGKGLHVVVYINGSIDDFAKVAITAILQSDMNRVIHDFRRALSLKHNPADFPFQVLFK